MHTVCFYLFCRHNNYSYSRFVQVGGVEYGRATRPSIREAKEAAAYIALIECQRAISESTTSVTLFFVCPDAYRCGILVKSFLDFLRLLFETCYTCVLCPVISLYKFQLVLKIY